MNLEDKNRKAARVKHLSDGYTGNPSMQAATPQIAMLEYNLKEAKQRKKQKEQERDEAIKKLVASKKSDLENLPNQFPKNPYLENLLSEKRKFPAQIQRDRAEFDRRKNEWIEDEMPKREAWWAEQLKTLGWKYHTEIEQLQKDISMYEQKVAIANKQWLEGDYNIYDRKGLNDGRN
ncbi:hypothetical protein ACE1CD_05405 [Aerosakkonema sp. BLCC-F183]|uniref:hypothetical protein n=1 Tax=Aerosakkonema sp. BLCC-F183 TaxID=3342834 RepID=UPI0035B7334B